MKKISLLVYPNLAVPDTAISWLVVCLILATLFYIPHLPLWSTSGSALIAVWRFHLLKQNRSLPSKTIRFLLTAMVFVTVMVAFKSYLGREPGLSALLLLTGLKLLEVRFYRDFMVAVFLCIFLVLGLFLFTQSILAFVFMAVMILLLTMVLILVNSPVSSLHTSDEGVVGRLRGIFPSSGMAFRLILFSIPLVLILFFFFPRSSGPLWDLPQGGSSFGHSGFGEFLRPGYVAWLAQSYDTAFRVRFPGDDMPVFSDLYFRGLVLWFTDGDTWFQGVFPFREIGPEKPVANALCQDIILEPHFQSWLFALDRPVSFPSWSGRMPGWTFRTEKPVERHLLYRVCSITRPHASTDLHPVSHRWGLQLPKRLNPEIRQLALQLKENCRSDEEVMRSVLNFFRQPSFSYTLNPGLLDRKAPIADFLLRSRKGFCEHYAASFGVLMRAAGVPTRVVLGYHGGKYNPVGGYLEIRQADAHAWNEVWIEGKGWIRVDPTAEVSPERIEYGAEISRSISSIVGTSEAERTELIRKRLQRGFFRKMWEILGNFWDNLDSNWNLWVIGYGRDRQDGLLDSIGLVDVSWVTLLAAVAGMVFLLMFMGKMVMKRKLLSRDPLTDLYRLFCRKMKYRGIERHSWEGPVDFRDRAIRQFPWLRKDLEGICALYIEMRYGRLSPTAKWLKKLKTRINKLKF